MEDIVILPQEANIVGSKLNQVSLHLKVFVKDLQ